MDADAPFLRFWAAFRENRIALVALAVIIAIAANFGDLAGATGMLAVFLPGLVVIFGVIGLFLAASLKSGSPIEFARLGAGQEV
jgi:cytochrome c biogenesis protein CcdA